MKEEGTLTTGISAVKVVILAALALGVGLCMGYFTWGWGQEEPQRSAPTYLFQVFIPSNDGGYPYARTGLGTGKGRAYLYDVDGPYQDENGHFLATTFILNDGRSFFKEKRTFRTYILALEPQTIDLWGRIYRIQWIPTGGGHYRFIDGGDEPYHQYQLILSEMR